MFLVFGGMGDALVVKETLLGWHGTFVGKKWKKVWRVTPLCFFWTLYKRK